MASATPLRTTVLNLANHQGKTWRKNIRGGVLAKLTPGVPELKVGATDHFTFTGTPKVQLVGESVQKESQNGTPGKKTVQTYKVQITYRFSNEVQWEDEDYQTELIENLVANAATAMSRALDLLAIHGINPITGTTGAVTEYLRKSGNGVLSVTRTANAQADLNSAAALLQGQGYMANGIGFDPTFAGQLARTLDGENRPLYPELGFGFGFDSFQGLNAAASDTVSGRQELDAEDATLNAVMGDFDAFKWGIARDMPLELIEYGDPDDNGDLKGHNEVAIRAESVIGFGFMDYKAFALIDGVAPSA
jgi:hypothetical protein